MPRAVARSRRARAHYHHLAEVLRELEFHLHGRLEGSGQLPEEWQEIARSRGPMPKTRVTLWVEGDVLRFFKGMGRGHTTRMSEVLRAFMHARLAEVLGGPEAVDYAPLAGEERRHRIALLRELTGLAAEDGEW
jgi:uncharacterized protein (DUF4415 family)